MGYFKNEQHFINWVKKYLRNNGFLVTTQTIHILDKLYMWSQNHTQGKGADVFSWEIRSLSIDVTEEYINNFIARYRPNKSKVLPNFSDNVLWMLSEEEYPGVYFLFDIEKTVIYIGKSKNLSSRIVDSIHERIVHNPYFFSYIKTETMSDAHLLELYYIAMHKPFVNKEFASMDNITFEVKTNYQMTELLNIWK
jgi:hypothetical protein